MKSNLHGSPWNIIGEFLSCSSWDRECREMCFVILSSLAATFLLAFNTQIRLALIKNQALKRTLRILDTETCNRQQDCALFVLVLVLSPPIWWFYDNVSSWRDVAWEPFHHGDRIQHRICYSSPINCLSEGVKERQAEGLAFVEPMRSQWRIMGWHRLLIASL